MRNSSSMLRASSGERPGPTRAGTTLTHDIAQCPCCVLTQTLLGSSIAVKPFPFAFSIVREKKKIWSNILPVKANLTVADWQAALLLDRYSKSSSQRSIRNGAAQPKHGVLYFDADLGNPNAAERVSLQCAKKA